MEKLAKSSGSGTLNPSTRSIIPRGAELIPGRWKDAFGRHTFCPLNRRFTSDYTYRAARGNKRHQERAEQSILQHSAWIGSIIPPSCRAWRLVVSCAARRQPKHARVARRLSTVAKITRLPLGQSTRKSADTASCFPKAYLIFRFSRRAISATFPSAAPSGMTK